jgi:hypothetical protein
MIFPVGVAGKTTPDWYTISRCCLSLRERLLIMTAFLPQHGASFIGKAVFRECRRLWIWQTPGFMYTWWRDHRPLAGKCPKKVDDEYNEGLRQKESRLCAVFPGRSFEICL